MRIAVNLADSGSVACKSIPPDRPSLEYPSSELHFSISMRKYGMPMLAAAAGLWLGAIFCTSQQPIAPQSAPAHGTPAAMAADVAASGASYRKLIVLLDT